MGTRINTIMQTCFFAISGVLPQDEAIEKIKEAIQKTYGKRGERVVRMNFAAVDAAVSHMHKIEVPAKSTSDNRDAAHGSGGGAGVREERHGHDDVR